MTVQKINIKNFRNLSDVSLYLSEKYNFFYGKNGSGKTSLLESIYYLGLNRSFRSHLNKRIINHHAEAFQLFASLEDVSVGIEKTLQKNSTIKVNSIEVSSIAEITCLLPLQLIDTSTYLLIDGSPENRRQFIDWGVFYVEPLFINYWKRFQTILKQRNASLRQQRPNSEIVIWDEELITLTEAINKLRNAYLENFLTVFKELSKDIPLLAEIIIKFYPGWDSIKTYKEVLTANLDKDRQFGYTTAGLHRADLKLKSNNPVKDEFSRGEKKLLATTLKITQGFLLSRLKQQSVIYLIDDLSSELDQGKQSLIIDLLNRLDTQVFITNIEKSSLITSFNHDKLKVFHVEQGKVTEESL